MTRKGCIVTVVVALLVLIGLGTGLYYLVENDRNPYYHGKRVYAWTDQAIHAPDPDARREAAQALAGAFKERKCGSRISLTMEFAGRWGLPKELVPFLIETLHAEEMPAGSYQSMALSRVEDNSAVPALVEVILHDEDQHARDGALGALCVMESHGKEALPALREAARDENKDVQRRAEDAVKEIEQEIERAAELNARYGTTSRR
jgi:HEAT repeat protein